MAEYIDIDKAIVVIDTRGREIETTVRHILDFNKGTYEAADVAPVRHGRWIKTIGENGVTSACRCNLCGFEDNRYLLFNYCPWCGAKMDKEEE